MRKFLLLSFLTIATYLNIQSQSLENKIVGKWEDIDGDEHEIYNFNTDGTYKIELFGKNNILNYMESGNYKEIAFGLLGFNIVNEINHHQLRQSADKDPNKFERYMIYNFFDTSTITLTEVKQYNQFKGNLNELIGSGFTKSWGDSLTFLSRTKVLVYRLPFAVAFYADLEMSNSTFTITDYQRGEVNKLDYYYEFINNTLYMGSTRSYFYHKNAE